MGKILSWFKDAVKPCPTCKGTGVVPEGIKDSDVIECPACTGKGVLDKEEKISRTIETPCDNPACKNGKVEKKYIVGSKAETETTDCPVCDGLSRIVRVVDETYTTHRTCPVCKGAGVVTGKRMKDKHLETFCPDCHGLGKRIDVKRFLIVLPVLGIVFINPLVAFVLFAFGGIVFSLYAIRSNKSMELRTPDEIYTKES